MRRAANVVSLFALLPLCVAGCDVPETDAPETEAREEAPAEAPLQVGTNELDVLFVIDDSISMADKQRQLAIAVERFVGELLSPPCVDEQGEVVARPTSETAACPVGSERAEANDLDVHIGVISSDLGCHTAAAPLQPSRMAHLLPTGEPSEGGVLSWSSSSSESVEALAARVSSVVGSAGEMGCGYEAPLEAMRRFLADPAPFESLDFEAGLPVLSGIDSALLAERDAFLRPTSALAVVLLSDENDCSFDLEKQAVLVARPGGFYRATSACDVDPNSACCTSCALPVPDGCAPDPDRCGPDQGGEGAERHDALDDHPNLVCFDQKRRYGVDFLHPVSRYVEALSSPTLSTPEGNVPNPIFAAGRAPSNVYFTSIVGVPWQDIAVDPSDASAGFRTAAQLESSAGWDLVLGTPSAPAADPLMRESIEPRSGTHPINGQPLVPPSGAATQINGREHLVIGQLQYACMFAYDEAVSVDEDPTNICAVGTSDDADPVCSDVTPSTKIGAAAFPGVRQLELTRTFGERGILGSVCAPEVEAETSEVRPLAELEPLGYQQPMRGLLRGLSAVLPSSRSAR